MTVVGVPGKSLGEVTFHWPDRRLLIVGDWVIGSPPGRLSLLREKAIEDLELDFDMILVGDGESGLHDGKAGLKELVATFPRSA